MTGRFKLLLLFVTCFAQWHLTKAADCADAIKPSNNIEGCEWNESTDSNGCKTFVISCGSDATIDRGCLLDSDNGPCFAHITRYYYNSRVGKCSPFVFGGCSANDNNFNSVAECTSVCIDNKTRKTPSVSLAVTGSESLNCTGVNEQYYSCGACDSNCNSTNKAVCSLICRPAECGCIDGYVRNAKNVCVAPDKCKDPVGPTNVDPNAGSEDIAEPIKAAVVPTTTQRPTSTSTTTQRPTSTSTTTTQRPTSTSSTTQRPTSTSTTTQRTTSTSTTTQRTTSTSTTTQRTTTTKRPSTTLATLLTGSKSSPSFTLHPAIYSSNSSIKSRQQLCSVITCPTSYTCKKGTCFPPSSFKKCDKLKLAVPADGCKHSFRNDSNGCAIPYLLCGNMTCGVNEEARLCGACDGTCGSPTCIPAAQCRKPSCGCFSGYVRDKTNKCVPKDSCPASTKTAQLNVANSSTSGGNKYTIIMSHPTTVKPISPSSTTGSFQNFHNQLINSIYTGVGPARPANSD